jgi:hypothetical protein
MIIERSAESQVPEKTQIRFFWLSDLCSLLSAISKDALSAGRQNGR